MAWMVDRAGDSLMAGQVAFHPTLRDGTRHNVADVDCVFHFACLRRFYVRFRALAPNAAENPVHVCPGQRLCRQSVRLSRQQAGAKRNGANQNPEKNRHSR
jgi:hypothetical protein